jgi:2-polyprenyl-6-methoxyphenol hydroxylase-like FAD-dependent oxidoreductase
MLNMRIVCIGGGTAGLYFALLTKRRHPALHITVVERNRPFDTFCKSNPVRDAAEIPASRPLR